MENVKYSEMKTRFLPRLGEGTFGTTYKYGDIVIKRYFTNETAAGHIKEDVFDRLKDIKEKSFIDLIDCSYSQMTHFCSDYGKRVISAYSSKYISKIHKKSIDMPVDYTINSLKELLKLAKRINELNIKMEDTFGDNLIIGKDNIVVIDPDLYEIDEILDDLENLKGINNYISDLWCLEYGIKETDDISCKEIRSLFFDYSYDDYLKVMSERLNEFTTPRRLIRKTLKEKGKNYDSYE